MSVRYDKINCLIVGFGSIGKRHASVLKSLGATVTVVSKQENVAYAHVRSFKELGSQLFDFKYVVIANETAKHFVTLNQLIDTGFSERILVEKPLFHKATTLSDKVLEKNIFVGYNLRFHPVLQALKNRIANQRILTIHINCGSYLPDWRPGRDYREVESSSDKNSGGVVRELSHELDYLLWLFGDVENLSANHGHLSNLDMKADDFLVMNGITESGAVFSLNLDFFDTIGERKVRVNTENGTYIVDLLANTITDGKKTDLFELEKDHTYKAMHRAILDNDKRYLCSLSEGGRVMELIDEIMKIPSTSRY